MGGRIALHAALSVGARVRRLVLVGASPGIADAAEREERRAADAALAGRIEEVGVEAFAREWAAQPLFAGHAARGRASWPTPTAAATRRPGSPRRCAGSARA